MQIKYIEHDFATHLMRPLMHIGHPPFGNVTGAAEVFLDGCKERLLCSRNNNDNHQRV